LIAAAGVVLLLAAAFIVLRPGPGACPTPAVTLDLSVSATGLTPATPAVCRGQAVTLNLHAEVDGIFHVHGLDDVLPATQIAAGEDRTFELTPTNAGQFPIELHSDAGATNLGTLTVNVP
jgi:hypothetical protein